METEPVPLVHHAAYDFAIPKEMYDDIEKLRAQAATAQAALARLQAENEALRRSHAAVRDDAMKCDNALCAMEARAEEAERQVEALRRERDEARAASGLGCDANGGGAHSLMEQGAYTFCSRCGLTIKTPSLHERARLAEAAREAAEAKAARLEEALKAVRRAIINANPDVLTCTLWMLDDRPNETVVDFISAALGGRE